MPFPWYRPDLPEDLQTNPDRVQKMFILELKERAALLMRLGYDKAEAAARLRGNVRWDFELHSSPEHLARVDEVVEEVFRAGGTGGRGTPSLDG